MEYRNVGASGLKVSEIAVGSWMTDLAGSEKARIAEETIRLAYDQGVNFFDSLFLISSLFRVLNEIVIPFKFVIFVNDNVVGRV